jgi:cobaltochelatase CobN
MLFFIFFFSSNILAKENKTIFSIVSDRSASNLNSGANTYLQNSNDKIIIRTVNQVALMSDEELDKYLTQSDSLLFCAVFGDVVDRLLSKKYSSSQLRISIQGDRRLLVLNNDY